MLRSIPGMTVFRPAGRDETAAAWFEALHNDGPSVLVLSRQAISADETRPDLVDRGAYIVRDGGSKPDLIILASGSELSLAIEAADLLKMDGIRARVVSMVSMERFEAQDQVYREEVLPIGCRKRLAVEAGSLLPWHRYIGLDGAGIGMV